MAVGEAGWTIPMSAYTVLLEGQPLGAPVEVRLRRLTLAPGASVVGTPGPGLQQVAVEAGTPEVVWADPTAPTVSTGTFRVAASTKADLTTAHAFAAQLRNAGSTPVVVLLLTMTPIGTGPGTPTSP